ncbi:MAG: PKD domain-containing protein [Bacteroidia bacterium]|nr:PKD domain-containing protein [Bacteroidia bacterium]MDW8015768.1 PKD domain-containing protein [Bacteroidia bacterium]
MRYAVFCLGLACAQVTTLYFQDFNGSSTSNPPPGWQLNTSDMGGVSPPASNNMWRIGAHYASHTVNVPFSCAGFALCIPVSAPPSPIPSQPPSISGAPNSEFIHISFSGYQCCAPPPQPTASFTAAGNPGVQDETYFAKYTTGVAIPAGATNVRLTLFWICYGNTSAYGQVLYSTTSPNGPWTPLTSSVTNSTLFYTASGAWQQWNADTLLLPVAPPTTVYIGLRFVNQLGANNDPPFIVDDIGVIATVPSSPTITLTSVSPSPVCAGSQLSVSFTHSGFAGSPSFQVELLDASNNVTLTSASSSTSPISLTIPASLPSGTYTARVVSGSVQSNSQAIQVINLSSFTCTPDATTIQPGDAVNFTLSGGVGFPTSGTLTVSFDPGDGSGITNLSYTLPGQLPAVHTHTYTDPGNYVATFTASLGGCSYSCQQVITVASGPTLTLNSLSHSQVCAGGSVQVNYTASGFPPGTQYTAQLLSGLTVIASGSGPSPITLNVPSGTASGSYTVQVQANTTPPTTSNTLTLDVLNLSSFSVTCSATPSPANAGAAVSLSVNLTPLSPLPVTVTMNPGDGSPPQTVPNVNTFPQTFTHTYTQAGTYTVTFTLSLPAPGCTLTCTQSITVNPVLTLGPVSSPACAGSSVNVPFTAAGFPPGTSFTAELRGGGGALIASASGSSSPISLSIPSNIPSGSYTLQVVSSSAQSNTASVEIINLNGFTCTPSAATIVAGQAVSFALSGTNLPSSGNLNVSFSAGDGSPAQNFTYALPGGLPATVSYTYTTAGTYTASFTVSVGGCSYTCLQTITVTASTGPTLIIGAVASPVCAGGGITIPFQAIGFPSNTTFTVEIAPAGSSNWTPLCTGTVSPISCILDDEMNGGSYLVRLSGGAPVVYSQDRPVEVVQMKGLSCTVSPTPSYANEPLTLSISGNGLPSGPFAVEWLPGAGLPPQNQNINTLPANLSYTYTSPGVYLAQVTLIHLPSGCRGRCDIPLSVQERPTSLISVSSDGSSLSIGEVSWAEVVDPLGRIVYRGHGNQTLPILRGTLYIIRLWRGDQIQVHRFYMP